jgi:oligopeptide transport system substrate-binding protein
MQKQGISRRWLLRLGLGLVSAAFIAACGGTDRTGSTSVQLAPPDQQVLRVRLPGEPKSIDPHVISLAPETTLAKLLFAGLFTYDEELKVIPNLASELPTDDNGGISKDGLTYTVKLKKDAKWSDGKPLSASDFVYSIRRALDPSTAAPYASFFHGIVGAKELNTSFGTKDAPKTPSATEVNGLREKLGVSAKDASTIVYQLREPNPSFLNILALWTAFPVRQDVVEKSGSKWTEPGNNVSNGAFMLKEWTHDQRIVMEPNPFWQGEKPKLMRVEVNFIADDGAAYAAYRAGDLDVVTLPPALGREASTPGSSLNKEFVHLPTLSTYAFLYNNAGTPFDNPKVRQAFGTAIDRNAYVEGVLQGAGVPTTSWIPPGMPGYEASLGKPFELNATKAKQLLAEAGFPEGKGLPKITFLAIANDTNRLVGQFIEAQLKKNLGVDVSTEYVDSRTFGARFTGNQYQVTVQRWNADWPYPDNWLPELFGTGAGNNHVGYSSTKFDDLMKKAKAEVDDKRRLAVYSEAQKLIIDEAVVVPLYNPETYVLVKPNVRGLVITALDGPIKGDYNLHKAYIAAANN